MPIEDVYAITTFVDSFSVFAQDSIPAGVAFSANGLKMFVVGVANDNVYEYACGSAFDVSTCGFTDSFDVSAQDSSPLGIAFSTDGLTMFVVGDGANAIHEYACGSAFDVSTCGFTDSFDVIVQDAIPTGVAFSANGLTMFVVGDGANNVNEYACGSAFDVSTCGFTDSFDVSAQDSGPRDVAFSANGLTMFVVGNGANAIHEYACGSAFDVSTCGFTDSFSVFAQDSIPLGIAFSTDGLKMFVVGVANDNVYEYTLEVPFDLFSSPPPPPTVGGEFLPIETTSLLLAAAYSPASWLVSLTIAALGIGAYVFTRNPNNMRNIKVILRDYLDRL